MFAVVHLYFARCTTYSIKPFRVEILQIFQLLFWKIDDFINSFWLNLTFNELSHLTHPITPQHLKAHGNHLDLRLRMLLTPLPPSLALGSGHGGSFLHFTPPTVLTLAPRLAISKSSSSLSSHTGRPCNDQMSIRYISANRIELG